MKKILFISHDSGLTGAPILFLNLAKILEKEKFEIDFVVSNGGTLEKEFSAIGKVTVLSRRKKTYAGRIINIIRSKVIKRILSIGTAKYDFILSNTITNGHLYPHYTSNIFICTYVHELPFSIIIDTNESDLKNVIERTKLFLSPSMAVDSNLSTTYNIDKKLILRLPYYIPDHFEKKQTARDAMRKKLGFSPTDFVVAMMGTMNWRKGPDVFLEVAKKVNEVNKSVKFIWCGGGDPTNQYWIGAKIDIEKLELQDNVRLIPAINDSWNMMASLDTFFLSSREDPYPLVVLEAAMMELPIVCFQKGGGAPEFVGDTAGISVPYLDIDKAAAAIIKLKEDKVLHKNVSSAARKKYLKDHSKENVISHFTEILERIELLKNN
jgi:glycosyltransferase involved in cell wall biosynthesis